MNLLHPWGDSPPKRVDYQSALYAVDPGAVNVSGLVHALYGVLPRIWNEARARGEGTEYVNRHPIVHLYVSQIAELAGVGTHGSSTRFSEALDLCKQRSQDPVDSVRFLEESQDGSPVVRDAEPGEARAYLDKVGPKLSEVSDVTEVQEREWAAGDACQRKEERPS